MASIAYHTEGYVFILMDRGGRSKPREAKGLYKICSYLAEELGFESR